jgi:hypothetical protein
MAKIQCPVCIENKTKTNFVNCPSCNYKCCKDCFKRFVLESNRENIQCLECKTIFTRETSIEQFGQQFITKQFTDHQKKIRYDIQMSLLPQTQQLAEEYKRKEEIKKRQKEIKEIIRNLNNEHNELTRELSQLNLSKGNEKRYYVWPCSNGECSGFLDSNWKCGLCKKTTCKECLELIENEEHICDENKKETAKLIKKDTKPCPSCGTGIFKQIGCNHMFCTKCNTPFDWKSGEIIKTANFHNPHYFEYLRRQGEEGNLNQQNLFENGVCDVIQIHRGMERTVSEMFNHKFNEKFDMKLYVKYMTNAIRYHNHINHENTNLNVSIGNANDKLQEYRVKILLKQIDLSNKKQKDAYIKNLNMNYKKIEFYRERTLILDTLINVVKEFILNIYNVYVIEFVNEIRRNNIERINETKIKEMRESIDKFHKNIPELVKYCKESHFRLARTYDSICDDIYGIDNGINLYQNY